MKRRWLLTSALVLSAVTLTSCSAEQQVATNSYAGLPSGIEVDERSMNEGVQAGWITRGKVFYITTWGSSSCPEVVTALRATAEDALEVQFEQPYDGPCTADYSPSTNEFDLPATITASTVKVTVQLSHERVHVLTLE